MRESLPNSKTLNSVMELAGRAAIFRGFDLMASEHVLFAIAVDFPGYWRKIGISPKDIIDYANQYTLLVLGSPPRSITPSRLVITTDRQAQDLARAERAEIVTIGHWMTVYLNDHERRVGPFNDAPFDPVGIRRVLVDKPFHDEPKTKSDELLREAIGEIYGKTPAPKKEDPD